MALLSSLYFVTAWWGLGDGTVSTFASLLWAPSGISLAALLLGGMQLWPGVALGAFAVNWYVGDSASVACGIAVGNTLEAIVGCWLLTSLGFRPALERLKDVFLLAIAAGTVSTLISPAIGIATLYAAGRVSWEALPATWAAWWLGDVLGDLLVAPLLFVWSSASFATWRPSRRWAETIVLLSIAVASSLTIFSLDLVNTHETLLRAYLIFPLIMLVAVRLNQRWTVTAVAAVAALVIKITMEQRGYFWSGTLSDSLLRAQIFIGILALSKMALAAAVMERKQSESEAQQAVQARDEFLSIASHELKTPLTSLSLRLQLTIQELRKTKSHSELDLLLGCDNQVKKLTDLLNELLDLTRLRSGRMQLEKERFDLCTLIKEIIERHSGPIADSGTSIAFSGQGQIIGLWDRLRMEQVVSNLISNAIKYGGGKPVLVNIEKDEREGTICISVKDHGIGISQNMLDKIFERFERAGIGNQISGLGLGLYIARQIVEGHGGKIWAESAPGKGSIFHIKLPTS